MQPTRPAPMSGGLAVKTKKCGWCGPEPEQREGDYTARVFFPEGLALTARGLQAPSSKREGQPQAVIEQNNGRMSGSAAEAIRQPRDRLTASRRNVLQSRTPDQSLFPALKCPSGDATGLMSAIGGRGTSTWIRQSVAHEPGRLLPAGEKFAVQS